MDFTEDSVIVPSAATAEVADAGTASQRVHSLVASADATAKAGAVPVVGKGAVIGKSGRLDVRRGCHQLRPMSCEQGLIQRADGSARMCIGDTVAIVGVYGPKALRASKIADPDRATIAVTLSAATNAGGSLVERELEVIVRNVCRDAVVASAHPRTEVSVIIQVVHDAGSLLACILNATFLALMDANIPLNYMFAGLSCGCLASPAVEDVLMDLNTEEQEVRLFPPFLRIAL